VSFARKAARARGACAYRTRMSPPRLALLAGTWVAAVAKLGVATSAYAQVGPGQDVPLRMDCPMLDEESRAALEARARAELMAAPLPAGEITIQCARQSAVVTWRQAGGSLRMQSLWLADLDPTRAVDRLLDAVHALRFEGTPAGPASVSPPIQPPETPRPSPPLRAAPLPGGRYRLGATVGIDGELWQGAIGGGIGGNVGVRLSAHGGWSAALVAGSAWGLANGQGIRAQTVQAALRIGYAPLSHVEFGLGAEVRRLMVDSSGALRPAKQDGTTGGAVAFARYTLARGPFELSVGPQLEWLAQPIVVELAGMEVFRIPTFVAALSMDGEGDLIR
jgi:hypothetical protein